MTIEPKLRGLYAALLAGEKPWSWDWKYNPNLKEHMHALGVIAANYNELEGRFYGLFYLTFDRFEIGKIVFSKLNNAERMDIALRIAENEPESFRDRYIHFINAYGIRAFRRRKHDAVEDGKRHRQDHGIGGVALAVAAPTSARPSISSTAETTAPSRISTARSRQFAARNATSAP